MHDNNYTTLHVHGEHSNFRLRDSINKLETLLENCNDKGLNGMCLTDHETVAGHTELLEIAKKMKKEGRLREEFTMLLGNEIYLVDDLDEIREQGKFYHFLLIAKNKNGHRKLRELSSQAWGNMFTRNGMERVPITKKQLSEIIGDSKDLIASTACFPKDVLVKTSKGLKPIQDIKEGDSVITHEGNWRDVIIPTSREYEGNMHSLKLQGSSFPLDCTENHLFYSVKKEDYKGYTKLDTNQLYFDSLKEIKPNNRQIIKRGLTTYNPSWIEAKNLNVGDYLLTPIDDQLEVVEYLDFSHLESMTIGQNSRFQQLSDYRIPVNEDLLEILGLFIADGHFANAENGSGIAFTLDRRREDLIVKVQNYFHGIGLRSGAHNKKGGYGIEVSINSKMIHAIFVEIFEGVLRANTKRVPRFARFLEPSLQMHLIKGYILGDGHIKPNRRNITTATISKQLAYDLADIFHRNSINPNLYVAKARVGKDGVNHQEAYYFEINGKLIEKIVPFLEGSVSDYEVDYNFLTEMHIPLIIENKRYMKQKVKINKHKHVREKVYCMNVEGDHSFQVNGVLAHNCLGSEWAEIIREWNEGNRDIERLEGFLNWGQQTFGKENFYIEIQSSDQEEQIEYNSKSVEIAKYYGIPFIVTTDVHFLEKEDISFQRVFLNSQNGDREVDSFYSSCYIQTVEEITENLSKSLNEDDIDTALEETNRIAMKCEDYDLYEPVSIPHIDVEDRVGDLSVMKEYTQIYKYIGKHYHSDNKQDTYFLYEIQQGMLEKNLEFNDKHLDRIEVELEHIWKVGEQVEQKISQYYVGTKEYIDIMWDEGDSLVGIARGSVTSLFCAYLLDIIQMNPFDYGLPWWRHIHESKASISDVD